MEICQCGISPGFDPDAKNGLKICDWLCRVGEVVSANYWSDGLTLIRAVRRLRRAARLWHNATVSEVANWNEFKSAIKKAFPEEMDATRIRACLASRKQLLGQSVKTFRTK